MKGKCRIRGPPKSKHRTNSYILVSENQFWQGIEPPYSLLYYIRKQGKQTLGRQGTMLNQEGCEF